MSRNEPKYLLVFDAEKECPFVIYEQAVIGGQIGQRYHSAHEELKYALYRLAELDEKQPVLLAYTTKTIDNTFKV
jgi:hypothetical protein